MTDPHATPPMARLLGWAGLLPQALALLLVLSGNDRFSFAAQALAFAYAALIFSFLGGLWWGLAARAYAAPAWTWVVAVLPSLIALAAFLPWALAWPWPGPSLVLLGTGLLLSLLVDRQLMRAGLAPSWWLSLRIPLSLGLGGLTLAIGLIV